MFELIRYGEMLFSMVRDQLVPFLTDSIESVQLYNPITQESFAVPWLLPEVTLAELLFGGGLIFLLGYRLVKFFTDIVF